MKEENSSFLPIGSVVKIRLEDKLYMILGYYGIDNKSKDIYDYIAVEYPFGFIGNKMSFFNRKYIKEVVHKGYERDLDELYEKLESYQKGEDK